MCAVYLPGELLWSRDLPSLPSLVLPVPMDSTSGAVWAPGLCTVGGAITTMRPPAAAQPVPRRRHDARHGKRLAVRLRQPDRVGHDRCQPSLRRVLVDAPRGALSRSRPQHLLHCSEPWRRLSKSPEPVRAARAWLLVRTPTHHCRTTVPGVSQRSWVAHMRCLCARCLHTDTTSYATAYTIAASKAHRDHLGNATVSRQHPPLTQGVIL